MKKIIKTFNPKLHPEYDYVDIKLYSQIAIATCNNSQKSND